MVVMYFDMYKCMIYNYKSKKHILFGEFDEPNNIGNFEQIRKGIQCFDDALHNLIGCLLLLNSVLRKYGIETQ